MSRHSMSLSSHPADAPVPAVLHGDVLYLDFDGVLHPENVRRRANGEIYVHSPRDRELFEHAALLEQLLAPYPQLQLVLSTSWVKELGYERALSWLPEALRARCVGATFHKHMDRYAFSEMARGAQVLADVHRRAPARWLAIDDVDDGWGKHLESHVVVTDEVEGIAERAVRQALESALTRFAGPVPAERKSTRRKPRIR